MRFKIRWKLMCSYALLVLLMGVSLYGYLNHVLQHNLVTEIRENLLNEARLARLIATKEIRKMGEDAPTVASAIAKETKTRVTIISSTGDVKADSEIEPTGLKELDNHLNRPEVQKAMQNGQGDSIRYSSTLQYPMLYVAFPFKAVSQEAGFLRLAIPLSTLEKTRTNIRSALMASLFGAIILSLLLSYVLSNVTSRSLRTMASIATQIGKGEFSRRIPVTTRDELGDLAIVMNEMTTRIKGQFESIYAEKNQLDTILRSMGEGLMVTDAKGTITMVNPAFRNLFSIHEEVNGKQLIDITRHPALNNAFKTVITTENEKLEEINFQLNEERTILTHWVPLKENGELKGVVAVFHDISNLKKLEIIRKDFVANVSHELRTPVTVIKGYAETLLEGGLENNPQRVGRFIEIIHNHAGRLANLIRDLLSLSELESGNLNLGFASINIESVVKRACVLLDQKAHNKKITIDRSGINELSPVQGDPGRLEQVLVNLLDNAIKYTPENGSVTLSAADMEDMVKISVSDTGPGIPPKDLPRIFERFYRVDTARSREVEGTGLGLAIVKHIVQLHGGTVSAESSPGKGATFSFTLKKA
ncbi:MAG: two-component system OmpR family phosphate regulon sensor histidine kinase [Geobacteraceae bacterium]|nr:MAG: two-component system OmpR family phosphate regulon sensor histidine kinase [Geobacteraceae bacterium]